MIIFLGCCDETLKMIILKFPLTAVLELYGFPLYDLL